MLDELIRAHTETAAQDAARLEEAQRALFERRTADIRAFLPAELWGEIGIPINDPPQQDEYGRPRWYGVCDRDGAHLNITVYHTANTTDSFILSFGHTSEYLRFDNLPAQATRQQQIEIAGAISEHVETIRVQRAKRLAEQTARAIALADNHESNSVAAAENYIANYILDDELEGSPEAMSAVQPHLADLIARSSRREDMLADQRAAHLAIAARVIAAAQQYLAEYDAYRQVCNAWAERETVRLWEPWCCWELRYACGHADDDADYIETAYIVPQPMPDGGDRPWTPELVVAPYLSDPVTVVRPDGSVKRMIFHAPISSELTLFTSCTTQKPLAYHRVYRCGGSYVNVPPYEEDEPDCPADLVAPEIWPVRVRRMIPEATEDSGYFAVSATFRHGPLWPIFDWDASEIAASTPEALIENS
jgi:hypothetical protein